MPYVQTPETCGSSGISLDGPRVITGDGPRAGEGSQDHDRLDAGGAARKVREEAEFCTIGAWKRTPASDEKGSARPHLNFSPERPWAGLLTGSKVS